MRRSSDQLSPGSTYPLSTTSLVSAGFVALAVVGAGILLTGLLCLAFKIDTSANSIDHLIEKHKTGTTGPVFESGGGIRVSGPPAPYTAPRLPVEHGMGHYLTGHPEVAQQIRDKTEQTNKLMEENNELLRKMSFQ